MRRSAFATILALILIGMTMSCKTSSHSGLQATTEPDGKGAYRCGRSLVIAWDAHKGTSYAALDQKQALAAISQENMAELKKLVGQMTGQEMLLFNGSLSMKPASVVHRANSANLKQLLLSRAKSIEAPNADRAKAAGIQPEVTPQAEDRLFGALNCVFATVGPPDGREIYGDVVFRLKDREVAPVFGTLRAGNPYMWEQPNNTPMQELQFGYAQMIVVPRDWDQWFAFSLIKLLRENGDLQAQLAADLIRILQSGQASRRDEFWQYVFDHQLGYLEAKYENTVPITAMESIEVAPALLTEIAKWGLPPTLMAMIKPLSRK